VYVYLQTLLRDLKRDVDTFLQQEKHNIFNDFRKPNRTTQWEISRRRYFIEMLCHLPYPDTYESSFLAALKDYYKGNETKLETLQEFEDYYVSHNATFWYTRDTFLYRLLNIALRQNNIDVIFLLGFYIKDIYNKLKNQYQKFKSNHSNESIVKVYPATLPFVRLFSAVFFNSIFSSQISFSLR
jgi:hypothetical protein